jgi:hypothetical protein
MRYEMKEMEKQEDVSPEQGLDRKQQTSEAFKKLALVPQSAKSPASAESCEYIAHARIYRIASKVLRSVYTL